MPANWTTYRLSQVCMLMDGSGGPNTRATGAMTLVLALNFSA
jgi:hypothetical protein